MEHTHLPTDGYPLTDDAQANAFDYLDQTHTEAEEGGLYPYDPSQADIDIREEPQTIQELILDKFSREVLILDPDFQRNFVWSRLQMCQFVESVLLGFPLPPLYFNEDLEGKYIVVDGRQRITALHLFLNNHLRLKGLNALPSLNGKKFRQLDKALQAKMRDKILNVFLIKPSVPMKVVYDIFYRINANGTQLNRQEIRTCIYLGEATKLLRTLADSDVFKQATDSGVSPKRKKDQEMVLRYLSFKIFDYRTHYNGDLSDFVEASMRYLNTQATAEQIAALSADFERVMRLTARFFGTRNFRVPTKKTRGAINVALMESVAMFFSLQTDEFLETHIEKIRINFRLLLQNEIYRDAIQRSTSDKKRVQTRFELAAKILGNLEEHDS